MKKLTEDQLFFLAFICAEQDRKGLVDAWPKGTKEREKAQAEYDQLHAYRVKRWGATKFETMEAGAKSFPVKLS